MERKRKNPKSKRPEATRRKLAPAEPAPEPLSPFLTAEELQEGADYDWCLRDAEVQQKYRGKFVAAHKRQVLGSGKTIRAAYKAAAKIADCPPKECLAFVYILGCPVPSQP